MAVITQLSQTDIISIIKQYYITDFVGAEPILAGVENTNYLLKTESLKYILTIFEKRVQKQDIPFFINLMEFLSSNGIPVPQVIENRNGGKTFMYNAKTGVILSFLEGKSVMKNCNLNQATEFGGLIAKMHNACANFPYRRNGSFGIAGCTKLLQELITRRALEDDDRELIHNVLEEEIYHIHNIGDDISQGIIHGDLFPDNVFFQGDKISGAIDLYFASYDYLIYDLAIAINAWCFDNEIRFNKERALTIINSYNNVRPLTKLERQYFRDFCLLGAVRFFLTRSYDYFHGSAQDANIKLKDPKEFLHRVKFFLNWPGMKV